MARRTPAFTRSSGERLLDGIELIEHLLLEPRAGELRRRVNLRQVIRALVLALCVFEVAGFPLIPVGVGLVESLQPGIGRLRRSSGRSRRRLSKGWGGCTAKSGEDEGR